MALVTSVLLSGCAAMQTELSHHELDVQTKMNPTIFLPPVAQNKKVVYVEMHNASGRDFNAQPVIEQALLSQGYRITHHSAKATYLLQANLKQAGKISKSAGESALASPYGSAISGAIAGAGVGAVVGENSTSVLAGGVIGGLASTVADSLVKNVHFILVVDVQVTAKLPKGERAKTHTVSDTENGSNTSTVTQLSGHTNTMMYRTRIVSVANQVNLTFAEARPALLKQLGNSIASIF